ncbi:TonB-dependent receptor [Citrifermentans bremense]|uniref:TonB-dependent receptor n=1 Tax=Citrifermentans bremense TaxID=60035 RepID=A0A6S6LXN9_9BACT|nr:TonB-dependent receptor [Citrifermentans bremense]BCG46058.1 TonB-dependent receptor [Citrifermentans bremense]
MNSKTAASFLAGALFLLAQHAPSVQAEELSGIYTLGEVVVSGGGAEQGVQATETVHTVSSEEIRASGAKTLDEAIRLLPGVNVRTGAEGVPRIDIRGFRTRHVLLLLDGVPMNSSFDMQFDPTSIPTENIAQIKLTPGSSSVLYGQGGLGGVINIITRKGRPGVQGALAAETGDREPFVAKGTVSAATERWNYFLSGSASRVDGFPLSGQFPGGPEQGSGYRKNSDRERSNLLGSIGFTPTMDLALGVTVNYSTGSYGKPASSISDPNDPFASPPKYARVQDYSGLYLQLAAEYAASEQFTIRGWAFTNRHDEELNQYDNGNLNSFQTDGSFREQVQTQVTGATLQPRYSFGTAGGLTLSLSAEGDRWENSGELTVNPVLGGTATFTPLSAQRSLSLYSASLEYEVAPLPGLGLVAGYGHYWQQRSEENRDDFSLLAGASYDVSEQTRLKAAFKRNVRFPSLGDLYDLSKGNDSLQVERSKSYEAGVERELPAHSKLSLTGFYTRAENLIQNDQAAGKNMNLSEVRFAGGEAAASTNCVPGLLLRASYAYLHSEDKSRQGRDQVQYTPRDKATLEANYEFGAGYAAYLSLLHVANQYFYTKDSVAVVQKAKLDDYTVVNLKLSRRVLQQRVTLYLGANNLFDQNYETSYGFPQAGRFIYGGFEYRL